MDIEHRITERFDAWYDRVYDDYERVLLVPVGILLLAALVLGMSAVQDGQMLAKGIDFTGGTAIQVQVDEGVALDRVEAVFTGQDTTVRTLSGSGGLKWVVIETKQSFEQENTRRLQQDIAQRLEGAGVTPRSEVSVRVLGGAVGASFFAEARFWAAVALLIMSAVIFVAFRSFVPSMAVIFAAFTDMLVAMAGMSLLGIELTLGSLAALLMLLGYSVDTDILLSTRVLKQREGRLQERVRSSIITGSTMTFAAIAAFTVLYLVSTAPTLDQIAAVILIGLWADLPITWLGNAGILKLYVEHDQDARKMMQHIVRGGAE